MLSAKIPKTSVYLILELDEKTPEEVTAYLKIQPDFVGVNKLGKRIWQIYSKESPTTNLEKHIESILKKIATNREEFKKLNQNHIATLFCSIEFTSDSNTSLELSPRTLTLLGNSGLKLEITRWQNDKLAEPSITIL